MEPEDYISLIRSTYPDEDPQDVVTMIAIVAKARADVTGSQVSRDDLEFAGKILCVIFDPVKIKMVSFSSQAASLRRSYRGIATSVDLRSTFRESLKPDLLSAMNAADAIEAGIDALFRLPATDEG